MTQKHPPEMDAAEFDTAEAAMLAAIAHREERAAGAATLATAAVAGAGSAGVLFERGTRTAATAYDAAVAA